MALSDSQRQFYENTLNMTRQQIDDIEGQIQEELAKVKDRLAELQSQQKAAKEIYAGACKLLGIQNDLEEAEGDES